MKELEIISHINTLQTYVVLWVDTDLWPLMYPRNTSNLLQLDQLLRYTTTKNSYHSLKLTYPFRGQVLHSSGHLVGTGQQVFEGELLFRHLGHIKGIIHAWWSPSPQVLPKTALGGVLHQHIQRALGGTQTG